MLKTFFTMQTQVYPEFAENVKLLLKYALRKLNLPPSAQA